MKFEVDKHTEIRSQMSDGDRRVLAGRVGSFSSFCRMSWLVSAMGTDGNSAVAS